MNQQTRVSPPGLRSGLPRSVKETRQMGFFALARPYCPIHEERAKRKASGHSQEGPMKHRGPEPRKEPVHVRGRLCGPVGAVIHT